MKKFAEAIRSEGVPKKIGKVAVFTFLLGAMMSIFAIVSALKVREELKSAFFEVGQIRAEQSATRDLLSRVVDAETALRGYGLMGDIRYLDPYDTASREVPVLLAKAAKARLTPLLAHEQFDAAVRAAFEAISEAVAKARAQEGAPAAIIPAIRDIKDKLDTLRREETHLDALLGARLEQRRAVANATVSTLLSAMAVLAIGLILLSFTQLREMALQAASYLRSESRAEAEILDLSRAVALSRHEQEMLHRQLGIALRSASIQVFSIAPDGVINWIADGGSRIEMLNHIPLNLAQLAAPDDREKILHTLGEAFSRTVARDLEVRLGARPSEYRWLRLHITQPEGYPAGLALGCAFDITDLKQREENNFWLMRELSHRSKNLLAIVQSVARQTARGAGSMTGFLDRFSSRLRGLAASHDLLVKTDYAGADLEALVRSQMIGFEHLIGTRVTLSGPRVIVRAEAAQNLGMALHELGSNALAHGALAQSEGSIAVTWLIDASTEDTRLVLDWVETNPRPGASPTIPGFGDVLISVNLPRALEGEVTLEHAPGGTRCHMRLPMRRLQPEFHPVSA